MDSTPTREIQGSRRLAVAILILAATSAAAETEIHRCQLDDGTVAFQETPCAGPAGNPDGDNRTSGGRNTDETPAADDPNDFTSPFDEPAMPATPSEPDVPAPTSENRAECEKTTRDAIDAIDLELSRNADSKEESREYLAQLLELTAQLRACKQL